MKNQAVGLLQAVRWLRMPLIVLNLLVVVFELLLGG
jgi:hypothetical protein